MNVPYDQRSVAVVGCGQWGRNLVRVFHELGVRLTLCDTDAAALAALQARFSPQRTTQRYQDILSDEGIEAVVLATPAATHFTLARQALLAGKDLLVEKPLATSSREGKELVEQARSRGLVLMTGHTFLYSPPVRKIKELLDRGAIGRVLFADSSRVNLGLFRGDVDVLWDLGPHDVSILSYLLGAMPMAVAAGGASYMREGILDTGYLHLTFPGGETAHAVLSWLAPVKLRRMTIVGREGMVVYDDTQEMEKVKLYRGDNGPPSPSELRRDPGQLYRLGDIYIPSLPRTEPLRAQCEEFIQCIRTSGTPLSDGELGVHVLQVLDGARQSIALGGRQVLLAPEEAGR